MRLFVAVVPPEDALDDLDAFLQPRRLAGPRLRWSAPEQWHVTLAFCPDVAEHVVDDLVDRLEAAAARRAPMLLALAGGGAFPHAAAAKVLWAGVVDAAGDPGGRGSVPTELARLAVGCRNAAAAAGARVGGGPFVPHVTLARLGRGADVSGWLDVLDTYAGAAWDAASIRLIASHLGEGPRRRPRYETLAEIALTGPPGP